MLFNQVIDPIRSRCLCIRVPSPSGSEVQEVLQSIAKAEDIDLPNSFAQNIAAESRGSLRRAILALEVSHAQQYPFVKGQDVPIPDWELYIKVLRMSSMLIKPYKLCKLVIVSSIKSKEFAYTRVQTQPKR